MVKDYWLEFQKEIRNIKPWRAVLGSIILLLGIGYLIDFVSNQSPPKEPIYKMKLQPSSIYEEGKLRVVSIFTPDLDWYGMEEYAKAYKNMNMTVAVFFFSDSQNTPDVSKAGMAFEKKYQKYCVMGYWSYPTGLEETKRYPFR